MGIPYPPIATARPAGTRYIAGAQIANPSGQRTERSRKLVAFARCKKAPAPSTQKGGSDRAGAKSALNHPTGSGLPSCGRGKMQKGRPVFLTTR